jgi:GTP-binding nuclear protein Ran
MTANEFNIALLGIGGVGKTAYLGKLNKGVFEKRYLHTKPQSPKVEVVFNTTAGLIRFWVMDTAGQYSNSYQMDGIDGAVFMCDQNRVSSNNVPQYGTIPMVLVLNKCDDEETVPRQRTFLKKHQNVVLISVKSNYHLTDPFLKMARILTQNPDLGFVESAAVEPPLVTIA